MLLLPVASGRGAAASAVSEDLARPDLRGWETMANDPAAEGPAGRSGKPSRLGLWAALALCALGLVAVYVRLPGSGNVEQRPGGGLAPPAAGPLKGLNVGEMATFRPIDPAPMRAVAFNGPTGAPVELASWKGRVVLVNLWATWCLPCRKEMPSLDRLQKTLGGPDFEVVALSLDKGSAEKPAAFLKEVGADALALYHDPSTRTANALKVLGMPTTILIDRQGREVGRLLGPAEWDSPDALRLIRAVIGDKS